MTLAVCHGCSEPRFEMRADAAGPDDVSPLEQYEAGATAEPSSQDADVSEASVIDAPSTDARAFAPDDDAGTVDASDAGSPHISETRADAATTTAAPSWAPSLVGTYAARVQSFAEDSSSLLSARLLQRITITRQGDAYELTTQHCEWIANAFIGTLRVIDPASLPPLRQRLVFTGDTFASEPIDFAQGYQAGLPECAGKPGEALPRRSEQSWITGSTCTCPGPTVPDRSDDCRITDPDRDGRPGYSTRFIATPPLLDADIWGVGAYASSFVAGKRAADGVLTAQVRGNETWQQFGCSLGKPDDCLQFSGTAASCAPEYNRAEFVPLAMRSVPGGEWNCAAIVARAAELFPAPPGAPPSSCQH